MVTVTWALGPLTTQARLLVPLPRGSEPPLHVGGAGPGPGAGQAGSYMPILSDRGRRSHASLRS